MSKENLHLDNDISIASGDKTDNDFRKASIPELPIEDDDIEVDDDEDTPPPIPPHRTSISVMERPKSAMSTCDENSFVNPIHNSSSNSHHRYTLFALLTKFSVKSSGKFES